MDLYSQLTQEWADAASYQELVPLESQPILSIIALLISVFFIILCVFTNKLSNKSNFYYIIYSVIASLSFGFGAIYLADSVGVYI
ncbi:OST5 family protein ASCRUDRAFT_146737 [Ascoidea rubescens DSM 1968]|uniref:Dolichyl-diphosphooligosaccharide-protein glycosyltransferase subunit OST5 n=1 Tax=Ascoidea rubescens DSM 1968 TaxID=1344418 RepID=A0A1D2VHS0_9ASCO|nr:hypothetical protein ASCRUDRAFT_146737 [Ascoidea rubescens DSM 1968]ODV61149.1 hypothetical protein ASCRUDRAFT_146737 [Ascoidea rubescens DSM 1968]